MMPQDFLFIFQSFHYQIFIDHQVKTHFLNRLAEENHVGGDANTGRKTRKYSVTKMRMKYS